MSSERVRNSPRTSAFAIRPRKRARERSQGAAQTNCRTGQTASSDPVPSDHRKSAFGQVSGSLVAGAALYVANGRVAATASAARPAPILLTDCCPFHPQHRNNAHSKRGFGCFRNATRALALRLRIGTKSLCHRACCGVALYAYPYR